MIDNNKPMTFLEEARVRKKQKEMEALEEKGFSRNNRIKERLTNIEVSKLFPFKNQPFQPYTEDEMRNLKESIKRIGLQNPIIIRKKDYDRYEILSGHNRVQAFKELGIASIEAKIIDVDDDTAELIMIDTNIVQRENLSVMERARVYKLKQDIKNRNKYNVDKLEENLSVEDQEIIIQDETRQTYYRYLSLNNLIPEYQEKCDRGILSVTAGEQLAKLTKEQQRTVYNFLGNCAVPKKKAEELKKVANETGNLSVEEIREIFEEKREDKKAKIKFTKKEMDKYFQKLSTNEEIKQFIIKILDKNLL